MGKGDKKTKKGKRRMGSSGKTRPSISSRASTRHCNCSDASAGRCQGGTQS